MKIMHICDWYTAIGGAEKLMFDVLHAVEQLGHENIMVMNAHPNQIKTGQRVEIEVPDIEMPFSQFTFLYYFKIYKCIRELGRIIKKYKPDVCHIHSCQNPYVVKFLMKTIPCVRNIHDPRLYCFTHWKLLPDNKTICPYPMGRECLNQGCISLDQPKTLHEKIAVWTRKHFDVHRQMPVFIMESRATIACMKENGFKDEQINWIPNFTPIRPREEVQELIDTLHKPEENHILMVGRASPEKGFDITLDAVKYLKTRDVKVHFVTGGPPHYEAIEKRVKSDPLLSKQVILEGILSYEKTRLKYAMADAIIIPSVWMETFCLVGLEAMANMKPVIGSYTGGIKDWLANGETGYHFEMGNPKDLAKKIDLLLSDKKRASEMGQKGYDRVCRLYNKDRYMKDLFNAYDKSIAIWNKRSKPRAA
ncbi:MAG: glycosyltransferase family 1 protein [Desulfobacteraceae bacterium]|nr:MAG: glycosyltransferase family 1 protein [Desulfobacteraceae bacterium]